MKKILTVFLTLCIALSIAACNTSNSMPEKQTNDENISEVSSPKVEDNIFHLNDSAIFENLKVTAMRIEESKGKDFFEPESGKIFVGVNFEIENISDEVQSISSLLLFDAYADNIKCEYSLSGNIVFGDGSLDGELSPGKKLVGWYAVEVPQEWQKLEFEVKSDWLSDSKAKFVFNK